MGFVEALMEGSSLVQEAKELAEAKGFATGEARGLAVGEARGLAVGEARGLAVGEARGEARGQSKGQAQEARRMLRLALSKKFPGLESMPEIDCISDVPVLEGLLVDQVMFGQDRTAIEQAIAAAVPAN